MPRTAPSDVPGLRAAVDGVTADLATTPSPRGRGRTTANWRVLARAATDDLVVARLAEAHLDAITILEELGGPGVGRRWGVWAAEARAMSVRAADGSGGWVLDGTKPWCSGVGIATHALVTAHAGDGLRLFAVDLAADGVRAEPSAWVAVGMSGAATTAVALDGVAATPVGGPGDYLDRPGFWHGAIGVAAAWFGGAVGALAPLLARAADDRLDPHAAAHLGAADAALAAARAVLAEAAAVIDGAADGVGPADSVDDARRRALRARATVGRPKSWRRGPSDHCGHRRPFSMGEINSGRLTSVVGPKGNSTYSGNSSSSDQSTDCPNCRANILEARRSCHPEAAGFFGERGSGRPIRSMNWTVAIRSFYGLERSGKLEHLIVYSKCERAYRVGFPCWPAN